MEFLFRSACAEIDNVLKAAYYSALWVLVGARCWRRRQQHEKTFLSPWLWLPIGCNHRVQQEQHRVRCVCVFHKRHSKRMPPPLRLLPSERAFAPIRYYRLRLSSSSSSSTGTSLNLVHARLRVMKSSSRESWLVSPSD